MKNNDLLYWLKTKYINVIQNKITFMPKKTFKIMSVKNGPSLKKYLPFLEPQ